MFDPLRRQRKEGDLQFRCSRCGEIHNGLPSVDYDAPLPYLSVPEGERSSRTQLTEDLCTIEFNQENGCVPTEYYVRANLLVPISGYDKPLSYGVWPSHSKNSFAEYVRTFDDDQTGLGAFGWLPVNMAGYADLSEDVAVLSGDVYWGPAGKRPTIELHESDHLLALDQARGITRDRAVELMELALHPPQGK